MSSALQRVAARLVILGVLLVLPRPCLAESVLIPGQEGAAKALFGLDATDLGDGFALGGIQLVHDRVEVRIAGPSGSLQATLYPPGHVQAGSVATPAGVLVSPAALPPPVRAKLVERLQKGQPLTYRALTDSRDEGRAEPEPLTLDAKRAEQEAQRIVQRVARRLRGEVAEVDSTALAPVVQTALTHLREGQLARARAALAPLLLETSAVPPMGAISAWIAAEGLQDTEGCKPGVTCVMERVRLTSSGHFSRVNPQAFARLTQEPRALVSLASQFLSRGLTEDAAAALWMALAAPLADPTAVSLARSWGWTDAPDPGGTLLPAAVAREGGATSWALPLMAALAFLIALVLLAWSNRSLTAGVGLVSIACGVLAGMALVSPQAQVPAPSPRSELVTLGRGGPCVFGAPWVTSSSWHVVGHCDGLEVEGSLRLMSGEGTEPASPAHDVHVKVEPRGESSSVSVARWRTALSAQVRALEQTGWRLSVEPSRPVLTVREKVWSQAPLMRQGLVVAAVVAAMSLPCLLFLLWQALGSLARPTLSSRARRTVLGLLASAALLAHLLAPAKMVMVFGGYDQVHHLAEAEALRYGPGATWIYGPLLWLTTVDHSVVQTLNRVLGLLSLFVLWALAGRLVPSRPRVPLLLAGMTVVVPLLWRDHASESLLVGGMLFGLTGLWALAQDERPVEWLLAIPCLLLAALTRPEFAMAFAVLGGALLWGRGRDLFRIHARPLGFAVLAVVCVGVFHLEVMAAWVDSLRTSHALEDVSVLELLSRMLSADTIAVVWRIGPAFLLPLILLAFWARHARGVVWVTVVVACSWAALTRIDLPEVSIPRVHAPIWLLWAGVGAIGADLVVERVAGQTRAARIGAGSLLVGLWFASAALTLPSLYGTTNEDEEEALIQDARHHLGDASFGCLATMLSQDPPPHGKASRAFPGYLFNHEDRPLVLSGLTELGRMWPRCDGPVYALLGVRCFAEMREDTGASAPTDATPLQACAEFRQRWRLEPMVERDITNHGDRAFPMYPATERLPLGFYRVVGPRAP